MLCCCCFSKYIYGMYKSDGDNNKNDEQKKHLLTALSVLWSHFVYDSHILLFFMIYTEVWLVSLRAHSTWINTISTNVLWVMQRNKQKIYIKLSSFFSARIFFASTCLLLLLITAIQNGQLEAITIVVFYCSFALLSFSARFCTYIFLRFLLYCRRLT